MLRWGRFIKRLFHYEGSLPQFNWIGRATTRNYNTAGWWMSARIEAGGFAQINTGRKWDDYIISDADDVSLWKKYTPNGASNI